MLKRLLSEFQERRDAVCLGTAERNAPDAPGLYAILVESPVSLRSPFGDELENRSTNLLYVGKASGSLKARLVEQDLLGKNHSTFFRSIGAVLDCRPPRGSLRGKKNQLNYRFSPNDRRKIVKWLEGNIRVRWVEGAPRDLEAKLITRLQPILNLKHNPKPFGRLKELRERCREIARG